MRSRNITAELARQALQKGTMPITEPVVTCDACGKDITKTGAVPAYRLLLLSERVPSDSDIRCAVLVYPPLEAPVYFCNLRCLADWVDRRRVVTAGE